MALLLPCPRAMQNKAALAAGLVIVLVTLYDVFQSVVVPRWTGRTLRLAPHVAFGLWPAWKALGSRMKGERSAGFLAAFGPLMLFGLLAMWIVLLILGYALIFWAVRGGVEGDHRFIDTVFLAGVSFLTIGMGEVLPESDLPRMITLVAGTTGTITAALVVSLTFTLYGTFSQRESLILTLEARAGRPPSGVALLETYAKFELVDDLPALFDRWEEWSAQVLESHLAYPLLPFFRSTHRDLSWLGSLGAVLDAATLLVSTVAPGGACGQKPIGAAHLMYHMGCRVVDDLSVNFFDCHAPKEGDELNPHVTRAEWQQARRRLDAAGFELIEEERGWELFVQHRAIYAGQLGALARFYANTPAQWDGDISSVSFASEEDAHPRAAEVAAR